MRNLEFAPLRSVVDGSGDLLQVILDRLKVRRIANGGVRFEIAVDGDMPALATARDRGRFDAALDAAARLEGLEAERSIERMRRGEGPDQRLIVFDAFRFRHASAGVLPLVTFGTGEPRALLFWRDIAPVGWNIANGASGRRDELSHVSDLALREAAEELYFVDAERQRIIGFGGATLRSAESRRAAALLTQRHGFAESSIDLIEWRTLDWGRDEIVITMDGASTVIERGLDIFLQHEDASLEIVRILGMTVPPGVIAADGELSRGALLDRPLGAFGRGEEVPELLMRAGALGDLRIDSSPCPVTRRIRGRHRV